MGSSNYLNQQKFLLKKQKLSYITYILLTTETNDIYHYLERKVDKCNECLLDNFLVVDLIEGGVYECYKYLHDSEK